MIRLIQALWQGRVPLAEAFWWYAVGYGLVLNLITSLLFLAVLTREAAIAWLVAIFLLPVPCNILFTVAVWRSADRYEGSYRWAALARAGTVVWMIGLTAA